VMDTTTPQVRKTDR